ncbi:YtxH domain-containing protein [Fredinandcohnia sp. QZ13]|uniref:YtxH domain-containing protein n=1 Tax=Fredinandcohnia sp. QZ13 TaxID=3073144 RepID=UPI0028531FD1|nr:YtxH domain-containing protein [Fredinandcohnia sp. QZ13]MDR4887210.1 YtxH domain-containing protein [Fredinandcohnia sp. QZ13]
MTSTKSLFYGLLIGSVIGGVSVLLSKPSSGKEVRRTLKNNQRHLSESLSQVVSEGKSLTEQVSKSTKQAVSAITQISADVKNSFEHWKREIEGNQKNIQKELLEIESALEKLEKTVTTK